MAIVKRLVKGSELTYEELDGNFTDLDGRVTTAQQTADAIVERTRKPIPNTTQYTLIAADYTDFYLDFTANLGQTIALNINTGIIPANGQAQIISSGNNFIVPTAGTGITFIKPPETNLKTVGKGSWLGIIETTTADSLSINGSLESTAAGGGIADAPIDGTPYSRQDASWVAAIGTTYSTFTNTVDGLVPAPNVSGTTTYSGAITSPAQGFTITEGVLITVTASESATTGTGTAKVLEDTGWANKDLRVAVANSETPYIDLAAMFADQGTQEIGRLYVVTDKGHFEYLGTTVGNLTDYRSTRAGKDIILRNDNTSSTIWFYESLTSDLYAGFMRYDALNNYFEIGTKLETGEMVAIRIPRGGGAVDFQNRISLLKAGVGIGFLSPEATDLTPNGYVNRYTLRVNNGGVLELYSLKSTGLDALLWSSSEGAKKTTTTFDLSNLESYASDSAAATGGVVIGFAYINSSTGAMHRRLT